MDLSTIIGILACFILMIWGIGIDSIPNFLDKSSAIIVIGGTFMTLIASYPFAMIKRIPQHLKILTQGKRFDPVPCIETLVEFAEIARQGGLLALEERLTQITDPFCKYAIQSVIDFSDSDKLRAVLNERIEN